MQTGEYHYMHQRILRYLSATGKLKLGITYRVIYVAHHPFTVFQKIEITAKIRI